MTDALLARARATLQVRVDAIGERQHFELDPDTLHHAVKVLRVRNGESVAVTNGVGEWAMGIWHDGAVRRDGESHVEPRPVNTAVAFAVTKGDRPEWTVQKLTEIGITEIVPFVAAHTIVKWNEDKAARNIERWRRIAEEAAMQSRRVWLPVVHELRSFDDMVADGFALAVPGATSSTNTVHKVAIGPEGGWSDAEITASTQHVSLGQTILRAETAAIVAAVAIMNATARTP